MDLASVLTIAGSVVGIALVLVISVLTMWKKVPPNSAGVVTGLRRRVITGSGGLIIPVLERLDLISMENMRILFTIKGLTTDGVPIKIESLTVIKVHNNPDSVLAAMEQFYVGNMERTVENIQSISQDVLEGKLREVMSGLTVEELFQDRDKFASSIQKNATVELGTMGLEIKSFTIKEIDDDQGYIDSLGKARTAEVKKNADIAEAQYKSEREQEIAKHEKESTIAVAEMQRDTEKEVARANQETVEAQTTAEIAIAEAKKQQDLKILENTQEVSIRKAISDKAYEIQANKAQKEVETTALDIEVAKSERQVGVVEADAKVQMTKEQQETEVARQRALRTQQELESTIQKQAEAMKEKTIIDAEADLVRRTKESEAKKIEQVNKSEADALTKERQAQADALTKEREAKAEAMALTAKANAEATATERRTQAEANKLSTIGKAQAEATQVVGEAEARATELKGLAEAAVIREKALAEAEGKKELAEAYSAFNDAALTHVLLTTLPEIARPVAEAVSAAIAQVDGITIIENGSNDSGGVNKLAKTTTNLMAEMPAAIKAMTGIDILEIMQNVAGGLGGQSED